MMYSQQTLQEIIVNLCDKLRGLLGESMREVILFGSYARKDADDGSDIDIMVLADISRAEIAALQWKIGEIAGGLLLEYGIMVSPIVENRTYFLENTESMPFFRSIRKEGVRIGA